MIHCKVDIEDYSEYSLKEGEALVETFGGEIINQFIFPIRKISSSSYISKGQVAKVQEYLKENKVDFIFWNRLLSHRNHRVLEAMLGVPVYDRSFLILDIFKQRATSSEEKLQVKLAEKEYEKSKLVRAWTHLERQRGGLSKVGGPGEKQIELDMQILQRQIRKIKKDIEAFVTSRAEQRKSRLSVPIVSLVGYTNVGKTTLFNALTNSHDLAEDKLFATLDPHIKRLKSDKHILISDTVGFIRNFPPTLSSAFMHTLEEIKHSKLILHIRDLRMPSEERYSEIIFKTLRKLDAYSITRWNVWNKCDLDNGMKPSEEQLGTGLNFFISAKTGEGLDELKQAVVQHFYKEETLHESA